MTGVFERGVNYFRTSAPELKEDRAMLLEDWLETETKFGELGDPNLVRGKLPKKLKRRRQIENEDGPPGYAHYSSTYSILRSNNDVSATNQIKKKKRKKKNVFVLHYLSRLQPQYFFQRNGARDNVNFDMSLSFNTTSVLYYQVDHFL